MEELKKKLVLLLDKADWTDEDKQWLLEYLETTKSQELNSLMYEEFNKRDELENILHAAASETILNNIHERIGVAKNGSSTPLFRLWHKGIAAAAIVVFCISGAYMLIKNEWKRDLATRHIPAKPQYKKFKNDVAPGGNKAVLTLADGSTILLDDAQNGTLAQQGKTKVLKLDGKLAYNSTKADSDEILYNTISTPRGGEYQVVLPDGSQVWLNAASSLRFPTSFSGNERSVEITGEAYFEVAKKVTMPFVVKVNNSEIRVLGTHFNIMAYNEEQLLKTTLLEGSVQFSNGDSQTILRPGQQSQLVKNGLINVLNNVNTEEVVAWKDGMFDFKRMDIETCMRQISRWYDIEVVYENHRINEKFIAEILRSSKLSDVLKALELTDKVHFEIDGKKVTVKD